MKFNKYNNISEEKTEEVAIEKDSITEPEEINIKVFGEVISEGKLNIRRTASTASDILTTVNRGDNLLINDDKDSVFYNVTTPSGIDGFAMKQFVKVNK